MVACSSGKIAIVSTQNGFLFSQAVLQPNPNTEKCFLSIASVQEEGVPFIILMTTTCEVVRIANLDLPSLEMNLSAENTATLLSIRDQVTIVTYDFKSYFTSLTSICIVRRLLAIHHLLGKFTSYSSRRYG